MHITILNYSAKLCSCQAGTNSLFNELGKITFLLYPLGIFFDDANLNLLLFSL